VTLFLKKIYSPIILNVLTAVANLASTFTIVHYIGIELVGKFAIFQAKIVLINLIYIILPPNYILVKIQDNIKYLGIYNSYYILSACINTILIVILTYIGYFELPYWITLLYVISYIPKNYFDVTFTANNKLFWYYSLLFFESILHLFLLTCIWIFKMNLSFSNLVIYYGLIQLLLLIIYFKVFFVRKFSSLYDLFVLFRLDYKLIFSYYVNTVLKKVKDTSIILLFEKSISVSEIGLYSIFMKASSFSIGLVRSLESFMMNKSNNLKISIYLSNNKFVIGFIFQCVMFITIISYTFVICHFVNFWISFGLSIIIYPYIYYIIARSKFLLNFDNSHINIGYCIFILIIFVSSILVPIIHATYSYLLLTYIFAEILNYSYVSYKFAHKRM